MDWIRTIIKIDTNKQKRDQLINDLILRPNTGDYKSVKKGQTATKASLSTFDHSSMRNSFANQKTTDLRNQGKLKFTKLLENMDTENKGKSRGLSEFDLNHRFSNTGFVDKSFKKESSTRTKSVLS